MALLFNNNAGSTLSAGVSNSATTLPLVDGSSFPDPGSDSYLATLSNANETVWEIVEVTAKTGNNLTVVRAQESTTGVAWDAGDRVQCRLTAGLLNALRAAVPVHESTYNHAAFLTSAPVTSVDGSTGAVNLAGTYAPIVKGVTNGDSHDHNGGDGAQIAYTSLSGRPTLPSGAIVGTTDTQTLSSKTLTTPTINAGYAEQTSTSVPSSITRAAGGMAKFTLTANLSPTDGMSAGHSVLWMVADGTSRTITWPTMVWVGDSAPELPTSGYACIEFWKIGTTLYGAYLGDVAS